MKSTGIVRRIDDLGRLVIPKEIRKMHKMKEGDSIEIYLDNNVICIKKYDESSNHYQMILNMCELLKESYKNEMIFNGEEYLSNYSILLEDSFINKSQKLHRTQLFFNTKVYKNDEQRYSGCFTPVVKDGIYYASFIMIFTFKEYKEHELDQVKILADLLARELG